MKLTLDQRKHLLGVARKSMEAAVLQKSLPDTGTRDPSLRKPRGAFVTLRTRGELRGCVGYFEPLYPLIETVAKAAVKAALEDQRFTPVSPDELARIRVEISALSDRIPVTSGDDIVIGRDGLFLESETARGVLLPQVAEEYGWDAETFVRHVCLKSGLGPVPVGTPGISFYRFTAEIFSETEGRHPGDSGPGQGNIAGG